MTTQNFPGDPAGFIFWAKPAGTWLNWTQYVTRPITVIRANPGQAARVNVNLWVLGGGLTVPDFMPVRIEDPYQTNPTYPLSDTGLHIRYFNGYATNNSPTIQNNVIQAYTLECSGQDWLWQNPPARPTTTLTVGAPPVWLPNHTYSSGDVVQPNPTNNHKYTSSGGISGATQPAFPTGAGATVTDGSGSTQITWTEAGSAAVSDQDIILQLLDIYYPVSLGVITHNSIQKLITSVPSFTVDASMTMDDVFKKLASYAPTTGYYAVYPAWPGAAQSVASGYQIEQSPSVNGLIWQCTTPGTTSGSAPAGLTSSTQVGQTVIDNTVVWTAVLRTGRWEASCNMITGQRFEPQTGALNGIWYQVISGNGTTAATPPGTWPTTLGATVTSGSITAIAAGVTAVAPVWQMWDPSDNGAHNASWVPDAAWFDSNTQTQTVLAAYSDTPVVQDTTHIHYASLVLNRQSTAYRNRWYIKGRNNSFAMVESVAAQNAVQGLIVSGYFSDTSATGPATNADCESVGANLLAVSIMRETAQLKSAKVLDPVMIQKLTSGQVVAALLGLNHTYPAVQVQVTLGLGAPVWEIQFGAGFLTDRQDPYSNIRGGRPFAVDHTPPDLVSWDNNPAHGNYFLPGNTVDPVTETVTVTVVWGEDSADADYFDGYYTLGGSNYHHSFARIYYPIQTHTFLGLPLNTAMQVFIAAFDHNGNVIRDQNGNAVLSASPAFTTATLPNPPHAPDITAVAQFNDNAGYHLRVTVNKHSVGDDGSHGGYLNVRFGTDNSQYLIQPGSTFPHVVIVNGAIVGRTYQLSADIFDQYDQDSGFTSPEVPYTVVGVPANAPTIDNPIFVHFVGGGHDWYTAQPIIRPGAGADVSNGGGIRWIPTLDGGPNIGGGHVEVIPPGATFPYTGNDHPIDPFTTYVFTAWTFDGAWTQSNISTPVTVRINNPPPPGQSPRYGFADDGGDQVLAGWLPTAGFADADFALVADATGDYGSASLQLINLIAFGGYKQIQSIPFAGKAGVSIYVRWGGKADATLCTGRLWVQPQSWTGNQADAPVSVGPPLPIGSIQNLGTTYPTSPYDGTFTMPAGATQFVFIYRGQNNNHVVTQNIYFSYPSFKAVETSLSIGTAAVQPINIGQYAVIAGASDNGLGLLENGSLEIPNLTNTFPAGCTIDAGTVTYRDIDIVGGAAGDGKRYVRLGPGTGTHRFYGPLMTWAKGRETLLGALKYSLNSTAGATITFGLAAFDRNKVFISRSAYTNPLDQTSLVWSAVTWQDQVGSMDPNVGIPIGTVYVCLYVEMAVISGTSVLDVDVFRVAAGGVWHYASGLQGVNGSGQYSGSLDLVNSLLTFGATGTIKTATGSNTGITIQPDGTGTLKLNTKTKMGDTGTPQALAHIAGGSTGANSAPLKLDSGSLLTTPETGVTEYEGNTFYDTPKVNRHSRVLSGAPVVTAVTVATTVTETVVFTEPIAANELAVGRNIFFRLSGMYSTGNITDTFTWRLRMGGLTGTVVASGVSVAGSATKLGMLIEGDITVLTTGSGGTVWWFVQSHLNSVEVDTHAAAALAINTTIVEDLVLTIQWSAANLGDSVVLEQGYAIHISK